MSNDDEMLTVHEVAQLLRVEPRTVRDWIRTGQLPAIRIGRMLRIRRGDLRRFLKNRS